MPLTRVHGCACKPNQVPVTVLTALFPIVSAWPTAGMIRRFHLILCCTWSRPPARARPLAPPPPRVARARETDPIIPCFHFHSAHLLCDGAVHPARRLEPVGPPVEQVGDGALHVWPAALDRVWHPQRRHQPRRRHPLDRRRRHHQRRRVDHRHGVHQPRKAAEIRRGMPGWRAPALRPRPAKHAADA